MRIENHVAAIKSPSRFYLFFLFGLAAFLLLVKPTLAEEQKTSLHIAVHAERLTVKAMEVPLAIILQEIAQQLEIQVYSDPRVAQEKITIEFQDLPIREGIERLLSRYNFAFGFAGDKAEAPSSHPRLTSVWVFPRGEEIPIGQKESAKEFDSTRLSSEEGGDSPDPSIRQKMVEALGEKESQEAIPVLLNFLKDPDQSVRLAAIDALNNFGALVPVDQIVEIALRHEDPQTRIAALVSGLALPQEVLEHHALYDPDPQVRMEALQVLEGEAGIEEVAREALKDPDPSLQEMAQEILQTLEDDMSSQIGEEDESNQEIP